MGIYAMCFLVSALLAGNDDTAGKSEAMLNLVMFTFDPEKYLNQCSIALRPVLKYKDSQSELEPGKIKSLLEDVISDISEHGNKRMSCKDLQHIADGVMGGGLEKTPPASSTA